MRTPLDKYTEVIPCNDDPVDQKIIDEVYYVLYLMMCESGPVTDCLLTTLAIYMSGDISDKTFGIFYGPKGNNGKSMLLRIIKALLGRWYKVLQRTTLFGTKQSDPNAHTAHLTDLFEVRLSIHHEASGLVLNTELTKTISGGDDVATRDPHATKVEQKISASHIIICTNGIPIIKKMDAAMMRRILLFPFFAFFTDNPTKFNVTDCKEYKADKNIEAKLKTPKYLSALFYLLCQFGNIYYEQGYTYNIPEEVTKVKEK